MVTKYNLNVVQGESASYVVPRVFSGEIVYIIIIFVYSWKMKQGLRHSDVEARLVRTPFGKVEGGSDSLC